MNRVAILGNSGSGKSTLAREISQILDCDHIELDAIRHLPGWQEIDVDSFRKEIDRRTNTSRWVLCGNASVVADIYLSRADTVIIFDLPRRVVMWRVIKRSLIRVLFRQQLWNGNRETLRKVLKLWNPHESIVAWAWTQHDSYRRLLRDLAEQEMMKSKEVHFVCNQNDANKLLSTVCGRVP